MSDAGAPQWFPGGYALTRGEARRWGEVTDDRAGMVPGLRWSSVGAGAGRAMEWPSRPGTARNEERRGALTLARAIAARRRSPRRTVLPNLSPDERPVSRACGFALKPMAEPNCIPTPSDLVADRAPRETASSRCSTRAIAHGRSRGRRLWCRQPHGVPPPASPGRSRTAANTAARHKTLVARAWLLLLYGCGNRAAPIAGR